MTYLTTPETFDYSDRIRGVLRGLRNGDAMGVYMTHLSEWLAEAPPSERLKGLAMICDYVLDCLEIDRVDLVCMLLKRPWLEE